MAKLIDQWGVPLDTAVLTEEIAAASLTGARTPLTSYPGDGLDPQRLASLLKEADSGDPLRYLELAETLEERDLHYAGVLGTRKRSVSQLNISVEPAGKDALAIEQADRVSEWLKRDELSSELFDMLDAVGKGYSFTEIIWDSSTGQWKPERLEWRDPRWFRFKRKDMTTPVLIGEGGQEIDLPAFKFIRCAIKAKSGLPVRSGLARLAAWAWMFKAFTQRDWAIFTQSFGQPVRIGKYGQNATADEKKTLLRAVANIASDMAAIIPASMMIEFMETPNITASADLFERRADWLDRQVSKGVLGQTTTTDAIAGGHAIGREHRLVQEDIERADARALSAILNRDLIVPWMQLEFGPQDKYPRLKIGREEQRDVKAIVGMVKDIIPMGLSVGERQLRELIGIGAPESDDRLLTAAVFHPRAADVDPAPEKSLNAEAPLPQDVLAAAAAKEAGPALAALMDRVKAMVKQAGSLEELAAWLEAGAEPDGELAMVMAQQLLLAQLAGQAEVSDA